MVTLYETAVVLIRKKIGADPRHAIVLAEKLGVQVVPFIDAHLAGALDAYNRYGKGLGRRPHLNFGDCVSYALAKALDAPLLYKGEDFAATDIAAYS
jgi:ribonuclease VapC